MKALSNLVLLAAGAILFSSCEKYFGDKTDLSFIEVPKYETRAIAYVPIQPEIKGFIDPSDIIAGYDQLIYVVDKGTQQIISYDVSGRELQRFNVPGVKAIAQDRRLDLIALGTKDTVIAGNPYKLQAIYRISLSGFSGYGLSGAKIVSTVVHPFYFKSSFSAADADVKFNSVATLGNNEYYVTRTGPRNSTTQIGGPEDAVLIFSDKDKFRSTVQISSSIGTFSNFFKAPSGITTLAQPPQTYAVSGRKDFMFTSLSSTNALKVQYVTYTENEAGSSYEVKQLPTGDTSQAEGFLYTPLRFGAPVDITYAGDGSNYIFVVDTEKDSLFQFTNTGLEGVKPPAGSNSKKYVKASFGGKGSELTQFNDPVAVAYLNRIVYVVDAGNRRVLRFKLTTDFD